MAPSGLAVILSTLLVASGLAATLHDSTLVRREEKSVHIGSVGQFSSPPEDCNRCDRYDYLVGTPNSNTCPTGADLVTRDDMCRHAASEAGAHTDTEPTEFKLQTQDEYETAPAKCFHKQCNSGPCYFYNPGSTTLSDPTHANFSGTPICKREKYLSGVDNSNAADNCGNADFEVITDRDRCLEVADYFNYQKAAPFDIGISNYTRHHDFPKGCYFIRPATSGGVTHVYFNTVSSGTSVTGTVLCKVTTPMHWSTNTPAGFNADGSAA
jgi:hypothetical protein